MELRPREPFDFHRTLRFILSPPALLSRREFAPLLDYWVGQEFRRVAVVGGKPVLYGVSMNSAGLRLRILSGPDEEQDLRAVAAIARRQLALDLDLTPFYEVAARDPVLDRLVARFRGMRIPQVADPYESLVSAILEQQINLSFAHQVKRALIEKYGQHLEFEARRYNVFPAPQALAAATPEALRNIQISGPKARYIIAISQAVEDGLLNFDSLSGLDPAAAHEQLTALKGVGAWTAHYVAMRALGHLDCLPAADVGLQKSIQFLYGLRKQPTLRRVESLASKWRGWRSYATFYLWLTYWEDAPWKESLRDEVRALRKARTTLSRKSLPA